MENVGDLTDREVKHKEVSGYLCDREKKVKVNKVVVDESEKSKEL